MIDTHYDLLSIAYISHLKNDYSYLEQISQYFNEENVTGVIANLYFMSEKEMIEELHPNYYNKDVSVCRMFKIAKEILDTYLPNVDILYSIEGADYIRGCKELQELYQEGLDALILCWNTKSKYASGNRSLEGLTEEGKILLNCAIDLGLGIDLSHANKPTFYDMVEVIKTAQKEGKDVCAYASHSNSQTLCSRDRNLDDDQLEKIKEINGLVGVFSNKNFIVDELEREGMTSKKPYQKYLEHIDHIGNIIDFSNVMCATDDMDFCKEADPEYGEVAIYNYSSIARTLMSQLKEKYGGTIACNIIYKNANKLFNNIRKQRKKTERKDVSL